MLSDLNKYIYVRLDMKALAVLLASIPIVFVGCGGGGGGGSGGDTGGGGAATTYTLALPSKLSAVPTLGVTSFPSAVSDYGIGIISFSQSTDNGGTGYQNAIYDAFTSAPFQYLSNSHIDSSVQSAWVAGWTGKGVTISVIDDFQSTPISSVVISPTVRRTAIYEGATTFGKVQGVHDLVYSWTEKLAHGGLVSNIAGGDYDGSQLTYSVNVPEIKTDTKIACNVLRAGTNNFTSDCPTAYRIQWMGVSYQPLNLSYKKMAGVAKEANVVENNVNLSSSQNPIQTIADLQGHLQNSANLGVINLSLGSDIPTSGRTFDEVMAQVSKFPVASMNSVIAVAAGNGGKACATQDLNGCNSMAVALAFQGSTKSSTIVVGATSGSGTQENIATYSTRAGILADRFVLASGDTGIAGVVGTSFAAPRVAGIAAVIKQKYPSLTSSQIASIILLSASKDINNTGVDTFTGVSPIYGQGKASLTRALALAASI